MRRQTLGPVSGSALNARPSLGRPSLGGRKSSLGVSRKSEIGLSQAQPRVSIDPVLAEQRQSLVARRSSACGVRGAPDPRPLTDKDYMNDCVRKMIDYLLNNGYDQRMDFGAKGWRPTSRDFQNIICFLFKQIDMNWQCGPKFDDEFIIMLKSLGYPYSISKSTLSAVGSPHTWPQLLGTIEWLIELLTYDGEVAATGGHASGGFEAGEDLAREGDARFNEYLGLSYQAFLSGEDLEFAALEADFSAAFAAQTVDVRQLVAAKEEEQARLMREIEAEKATSATLPEKRGKLSVLESDHEKLCDFVEKLEEHATTLEGKVTSKQADLATARDECDKSKEVIRLLKARVSSQELSADEAQRMIAEKERLERTLSESTAYHQAMRQKAWEADMELGRRTEDLERVVHSYTAQATALQLLPPGAKNAQGADYRIVVNKERLPTATCIADVLSTDVSGSILPALIKFKELISKKAGDMRSSASLLQDQEEHSQEAVEEAAEQLEELQVRHGKLEEALRREKEGLEAALAERAAEAAEIEAAIEALRDNPADRERRRAQLQKRLAELRSEFEQQSEIQAAEATHAQEQILGALGHIADYKAHVSRRLAETRGYYDEREASIKSVRLLD